MLQYRHSIQTLSSQYSRLSSAGGSTAALHLLEHGRILQHVRQYHETYFAASDIYVLQFCRSPVAICDAYAGKLAVHIVFGFNQFAAVHLPGIGLARHDVAFGLMKNLNRNTDRHSSYAFGTRSIQNSLRWKRIKNLTKDTLQSKHNHYQLPVSGLMHRLRFHFPFRCESSPNVAPNKWYRISNIWVQVAACTALTTVLHVLCNC